MTIPTMQNLPPETAGLTPHIDPSQKVNSDQTTSIPEKSQTELKPESNQQLDSQKISSERFAHLQKKEAALLKKREEFRQQNEKEKSQLQKDREEIASQKAILDLVREVESLRETDPVAALRKAGFKEEDFVNFLAEAQKELSPEEKAAQIAKKEIENFKKEQEDLRKKAEEEQFKVRSEHEKQVLENFKKDVNNIIEREFEKFEYCKFHGEDSINLVVSLVEEMFKESGKVPDIEDAIQLAEDYYEEYDNKLNSLKKRQAKLQQVKQEDKVEVKSEQKEESILEKIRNKNQNKEEKKRDETPIKTLSNDLNSVSTTVRNENLTPEQRKRLIVEKFKAK